jgi:pimeloyl-ACP methyl ester carboxylesterase
MSYLHYVARGDGPPVILMHGVAASLYDWDMLAPALAAQGYRTLAVDLPGHGESVKPDEDHLYTAEHFYQVVENWIDGLKDGPPYVLVGHSFGGYLSLSYAIRHPDKVRALVLIAPFFSTRQLSPVLQLVHRTPTPAIRALPYVPLGVIDLALGWDPISAKFSRDARWQIAVDYKRADPHILNLPRTIDELGPRLHQVSAPAKVIWGALDLTLMPDSFPQLVSALPRGDGLAIPLAGHQPHIGQPERVNRMVIEFIQRQAPTLAGENE